MSIIEQYRGYNIHITSSWYRDIDGFSCALHVYKENDNELSFSEIYQISHLAIMMQYGKGEKINAQVEKNILERAYAVTKLKIDFQLYNIKKEYMTSITSTTLNSKSDKIIIDSEIQLFLLDGLKIMRKNNPVQYKWLNFDPLGIFDFLNIKKETYLYNADLLMECKLIGTNMDNGIELGFLYITSDGINLPTSRNSNKQLTINNFMNQNNITNSGDGNLFNTGDNNTINQTVSIEKGNFEQLKQSLLENGVSGSDIIELEQIIGDDIPIYAERKFGTKVNSWIQKMMGKALDGSWQIGVGAAGSVLAEVFMKYYGM